jgi:hypothetical protein
MAIPHLKFASLDKLSKCSMEVDYLNGSEYYVPGLLGLQGGWTRRMFTVRHQ